LTESFFVLLLPASSTSFTVSFAYAFLPCLSALVILCASFPFFGFSFSVFDLSDETFLLCGSSL
jgi:multidrug transporter EmrE-like cation transporter